MKINMQRNEMDKGAKREYINKRLYINGHWNIKEENAQQKGNP